MSRRKNDPERDRLTAVVMRRMTGEGEPWYQPLTPEQVQQVKAELDAMTTAELVEREAQFCKLDNAVATAQAMTEDAIDAHGRNEAARFRGQERVITNLLCAKYGYMHDQAMSMTPGEALAVLRRGQQKQTDAAAAATPTAPDTSGWLTVKQAAIESGKGEGTISKWCNRTPALFQSTGRGPERRIDPHSFLAYLARRKAEQRERSSWR